MKLPYDFMSPISALVNSQKKKIQTVTKLENVQFGAYLESNRLGSRGQLYY